jgi:alpha/beta superfamily hydrolase
MGVHPDFGIVGALRTRLVEKGFATLSIQMPVQGKEAAPGDYVETFPEAAERIGKAAVWLKGKGYTKIALISHSLGGRMVRAYFLADKNTSILAWAALSLGFDDFKGVTLPVLDLYAEQDHPPVLKMVQAHKRSLVHPTLEQHKLLSTGHFYDGKEAEVVDLVGKWLKKTLR